MTRDEQGDAPSMTELPLDFTAFHAERREPFVGWSDRYLRNRQDAEEAVDEAFEQLAVNWQQVLSMENPAGYAWQVMKNRTIDCARARGRRADLVEALAFETQVLRDAVDPIGELEDSMQVFRAVKELSERQHDVFVLRHCEGYGIAKIADLLGITEATVRSTDRYARRRLREILRERTQGRPQ
ncbi:RNA polymerase sigma factor [Streptomyces sparsus]